MLTPFSQNDPQWASEQLGTCTDTIGQSGCYLTAFACFANPHHLEVNPSTLNARFRDAGVYVSGCLLPDDGLQRIFPELQLRQVIDFSNRPADLSTLSAAEEEVVIVELAETGHRDHFVPIAANVADDPVILDVWDGTQKPVSSYGDPKTIIVKAVRYAYQPPPEPTPAPAPTPQDAPPSPPPPPAPAPEPGLHQAIADLSEKVDELRATVQDLINRNKAAGAAFNSPPQGG